MGKECCIGKECNISFDQYDGGGKRMKLRSGRYIGGSDDDVYSSKESLSNNDSSKESNYDSSKQSSVEPPLKRRKTRQTKKKKKKETKKIFKTKRVQHHTLIANIGRMNTYVRWIIEAIIGHYTRRWGIWCFCPWWGVPLLGFHLQSITALHCFLGIGVITETEERHELAKFIRKCTNTWLAKHPISLQIYEDAMKMCRKRKRNVTDTFVEVKFVCFFLCLFV